jgi:isoleucyl-tRNA synthetase
MTDAPSPKDTDYKDTVFLPVTDFPMKAGLAQKEPAIAERWAKIGVYEKLRETRKGRERFILHDGPPYANGDIHMGHAMNKVLKDIIVRSQSLLGKDAPYVPGWDCHGLPIEWKIEEEYRKKKLNKDEVPAQEFRAQCRDYADKWVGVQKAQFQRLGVMGDWDDPYLTMKYEAEAAIVAELLKFAESGQLYRGAKPVMWSPVEKTALAEAEVEYEDVTSTQIDVAFEIDSAPFLPEVVGAYAVIWTTTPWTIPVNQALAVGDKLQYQMVTLRAARIENSAVNIEPDLAARADRLVRQWNGRAIVIATDLLVPFLERLHLASRHLGVSITPAMADQKERGDISFPGSALIGATARHPMHHLGGFFAKPRPFIAADHVTTDAGTGLVHMAPDHGEEDFIACKAIGINPVFAVEGDGKYQAEWLWLGGQGSVINPKFNAPDGPICSDLKEAGALLAASADFQHSYPHSWRSKARIIYRCTPQWFIPMDQPSSVMPAQAGISGDGAPTLETPAFAGVTNVGQGNGATLRETALDAIENTRWVPERSKNRIRSMVEGRPDWVISRQRAWGVPIALYVHKQSGEYLNDPAVNARIVEAFKQGGADAWFGADHQALLGPDHRLDDYEVVNDILDVWFDSGSTHSFVVEARYGVGTRASLYLEGSDQHRGWFQSSLLESCGTRGRAPYDAVLTHGFALDQQGRKMSKSLGNVVDPLKIIGESGADILRMWVASTDYFDDVRIGKEVLAGSSDAYRKLRNSFRYMLGALSDFDESEKVPVSEMPELERYILHRLAELDAELRAATDGFTFGRYMRALTGFAQDDLSAFFFDIRKDCLYCDAKSDPKRRAYRTVLDTLFHALVRYAAPVIPFTAEEVWQSRFPSEDGSVHFLEWPAVDAGWLNATLAFEWADIRTARTMINEAIEPYRRDKRIRSSLEADVIISVKEPRAAAKLRSVDMAEICITSTVMVDGGDDSVSVSPTDHAKCDRCWRHLPDVNAITALCGRCEDVLKG